MFKNFLKIFTFISSIHIFSSSSFCLSFYFLTYYYYYLFIFSAYYYYYNSSLANKTLPFLSLQILKYLGGITLLNPAVRITLLFDI